MKNIKKLKNITLFFALATASVACTTTVEETAPASFITAETIKASYAPYKIVTMSPVSEVSKSQVVNPVVGENQMWDFSALSYDKDMTMMMEAPTTNTTFKGASFSTVTQRKISTLSYDVTNHYAIKADGVYQLGYTSDAATSNVRTTAGANIIISKFAEDVVLSEPMLIIKFPLDYGYNNLLAANEITATNNFMASSATSNSNLKAIDHFPSFIQAIASGKLKLKNGTFDVLVVRRNTAAYQEYEAGDASGYASLNLLNLSFLNIPANRYEFYTREKLVFVIDNYDGMRNIYAVR